MPSSSPAGPAGRVRRRRLLAGAAAAWLAGMPVRAQPGWPLRPIRIVVPFPAGSAADAIPRGIAQRLPALLGVPCVVDNRPGAAGSIGAAEVAAAEPDGHTLLSHTSTFVIQPHLQPPDYDVLRHFVPVAQTVAGSYVLVVRDGFPAHALPEFVAHVRERPGGYSYGSHGSGSGPHLAMELLKQAAGLFILHVPFRGAAPALQELLSGRLDMAFETTFAAVPHLRAGRLHAVAVGGPQPVAALPGTPTVASLFPGFDTDGWQGLFAPAGTPPDIVARLHEAVAAALAASDFAARIQDLGFRPVASTPQDFAMLVHADHARYGSVVRERGIRAD